VETPSKKCNVTRKLVIRTVSSASGRNGLHAPRTVEVAAAIETDSSRVLPQGLESVQE